MLLSELKEGQKATVVRVGGNGLLRRRIQEMGVVKGADLHVEKYAPLKDPMEIVLKGFHISLRVEEAADIVVENVR
jgi:Fe2+ transport system protein FeoA